MPLPSKISGDLRLQVIFDQTNLTASATPYEGTEWYDVAQYKLLGVYCFAAGLGPVATAGLRSRFDIGDDDLSATVISANDDGTLEVPGLAVTGTAGGVLEYCPMGSPVVQTITPGQMRAFAIKGAITVATATATRAVVALLLQEWRR